MVCKSEQKFDLPLHHPPTKVRTRIALNKINKLVYLFREYQIKIL